ncbi:hypothetical protein UA08_02162 [Talaromyces atroroseus]|uniref:High-affinity methionine permease n=1 Tax=Talaromyces atroroseus TaxID=1441469 RepID=A0A225AUV6_TALAT|nr:hypothetical protein UA08_02162 [Talaromyces atroroseus]OKL62164.1 hypothetical protein UA08_02162 [Talaromyces atroroseus]
MASPYEDVKDIGHSVDPDFGEPDGDPNAPKNEVGTELKYEEYSKGGLGRHLGIISTTFLVVGRIIGVGIFSTPSSVTEELGSVGASLMFWVLGLVLCAAGLCVWLEFACMIPRSGGEKNYLEAVYKKPKLLISIVFAVQAIALGFTASGCVVFAEYILEAANAAVTEWAKRGIAIGVIVFITLFHTFLPKWGVRGMNLLTIMKIVLLLFIVVTGWVVLAGGVSSIPDPHASFKNAFAGSTSSSNLYASALYKVLNSYAGWSNAMYVLNEVKNPVRTMKIAGPLGLLICGVLYVLANISYYAAATPDEIAASGVTVAGYFMGKELAKEGVIPFPKFWASSWPFGSPSAGLLLHFIPSFIVIVAIPFGDAYDFILDLEGYPGSIINFLVVIGLFWFRWRHPEIHRPFKCWWPIAGFFMVAQAFQLVAPFLRPPGGKGDTSLPYWLSSVVGIAVLAASVVYWAIWWVALPAIGKYTLEPQHEHLKDGTVVVVYKSVKTSYT